MLVGSHRKAQTRAFRKYFASEENFTVFHKLEHRLREASTIALTHKLQEIMVAWLKSRKDNHVAQWFQTYGTDEHGSHTDGYV